MSTADDMTEDYIDQVALLVYAQDGPVDLVPGHKEVFAAYVTWHKAQATKDKAERAVLLMAARMAAGKARAKLQKAVGL